MTKQSLKTMEGLDAKQYRQVGSAIFSLFKNPTPHDSQILQGGKYGERRLDVGEYRIIYSVSNNTLIEILVIGKRNGDEVYKTWERRR